MSAERFSAPFVRQFVLPTSSGSRKITPGYYRSKLFIATFSKNPLVAAAGPILSLLERLCIALTLPPITEIRKNIEHELQAFHSRLNEQAYVGGLDALAHYLLCATIDELLGKNYLRLYGKAVTFQAFTPSHLDEAGPQTRFFNIVHYIKEAPDQYLDLIELAYYCLITGFEGEQHGRTEGRQVLDDLIEELYQLIKKHRVNKSYRLFPKNESLEVSSSKNYKSIIFFSVLIITAILSSTCFVSHYLLSNKVNSIQLAYKSAIKWDNNE